MHNRYSDFEELPPTEEASHVPDAKLNTGCDSDPQRQYVVTTTEGNSDEPATTEGECRSCRMSITAGQTKCRFCLTNHLDDDATGTGESMKTVLLRIVHVVVESTTFYGAVAKGGAAANLITSNDAELAVDDYTLCDDLDEALAGRPMALVPRCGTARLDGR
jgi:hypothetical protein